MAFVSPRKHTPARDPKVHILQASEFQTPGSCDNAQFSNYHNVEVSISLKEIKCYATIYISISVEYCLHAPDRGLGYVDACENIRVRLKMDW